ncbi:proline--tRNA ligase [Paenibacillus sp. P22]|uniref:proline--tRNA ligase n=1 Tax=Paenibacillus sp. P22 TaxID=483908 RepID=UPI0006610284|nr:proline--tRNA ligase [Paenibacillus sp. P22]
MLQSKLLLSTLRDTPGEAEAASHRLLLRAGFIRQTAAGIYSYLPLGRKVLRKAEQIIREEMEKAGAQEVLLPALQPTELWRESGRYDAYGPELMRMRDRHDREFALGPTHEEVVTSLVRDEVSSYRRLPLTVYQIQTKFRDERRPRFGLLRGREFLMKDAYSFDTTQEGLDHSYQTMFEAYNRIFSRLGLTFRPVEADAGTIGGDGGTHEFMALASIGEDTIASCTCCGYAANLEKAEPGRKSANDAEPGRLFGNDSSHKDEPAPAALASEPEKIHTPGVRTIGQLTAFLELPPSQILKTVLFEADGSIVAVVVRGDHEINELKVKNFLGADSISLAEADEVMMTTGAPVGFAGPLGLDIPVYADHDAAAVTDGIAGANEEDFHIRGVHAGRHLRAAVVGDFRNAQAGDLCPKCREGALLFHRGIEMGQVFKLGTKYSEKLGATFLDADGKTHPMIMGCYGIGVSRLLSAAVEQSHDENGIVWPAALAPFHVHVIPVSVKDEVQMALAHKLRLRLEEAGAEVLVDDRDERPGVKFKDADLIGIPARIVVGRDAADGRVEFVRRGSADKASLAAEEAAQRVLEMVQALRTGS